MIAKRTYTLSKIEVWARITSSEGTYEIGSVFVESSQFPKKPDILLSEVAISYRVNDVAEASVALGYTTQAGLATLRKLFPTLNDGIAYARLEIFLNDGGALSYAPLQHGGTKKIFTGIIVGFSHGYTSQSIAVSLNAFSSAYPLTQIPVSSPGFHPTTSTSLGSVALVSNSTFSGASESGLAGAEGLLRKHGTSSDPVDIVRGILTEVVASWSTSGTRGLPSALESAIRLASAPTGARVTALLNAIQAPLPLPTVLTDTANLSVVTDIIISMYRSSSVTFWNFLTAMFAQLGLDLLPIGDFIFVVPTNPLGAIPSNHVIKATEQAVVEIRNFPFDSPTRCLVMGLGETTTYTGVSSTTVGEYPQLKDSLTSQEEVTGVRTVIVQAPAFLPSSDVTLGGSTYGDRRVSFKKFGGLFSKNLIKQNLRNDAVSIDKRKKLYDMYAQFILMTQKFRQRTGSMVMRYRPDVLPGFCVRVEDPITADGKQVAPFSALVADVKHDLSAQSAVAQTSCSLTHIRYDGEILGSLVDNPMYPGFDIPGAATAIAKSLES